MHARAGSNSQGRLAIAIAVLSVGSLVTIVVDLVGSGRSVVALIPPAAFVLFATVGFRRVLPRRGQWPAYAYVVGQLALGYAVFALHFRVVGATLLFVVLVIQSVLVLPPSAVAVVVALVPLAHAGMSWREGLREGLGLLLAVASAAVITMLFTREQRARAELAEAHVRLREYAWQAETLAAAQERNRIARDIHDGLGHSLTVIQMQIKAARAVLPGDRERADAMLGKAQVQAERALSEVRQSVAALREPAAPMPLPEALRTLADEATAAGTHTTVSVVGAARKLPDEVSESLYRAAQEGLTNVRKHARASGAALTLDFSAGQTVRLDVHDDGNSVPSGEPQPSEAAAGEIGFGLIGIQERTANLGGRMTFATVPGQGSRLSVEVPA